MRLVFLTWSKTIGAASQRCGRPRLCFLPQQSWQLDLKDYIPMGFKVAFSSVLSKTEEVMRA
mgnify:CR=1 FL=1|jgi:hypothetical protein